VTAFRRVGVITAHELRLIARDPTPLLVLIVFPVITIAFLKPALQPALVQGGYPDASGAEQVVPGQAVMSAFFLVSLVTLAFFAEHGWSTWERLRATPASSLDIVVGKALPRVGDKRASLVMARYDIAANRRIRGLGRHQLAGLKAEFGER
jgi:ABC-2 type transport system permease protein